MEHTPSSGIARREPIPAMTPKNQRRHEASMDNILLRDETALLRQQVDALTRQLEALQQPHKDLDSNDGDDGDNLFAGAREHDNYWESAFRVDILEFNGSMQVKDFMDWLPLPIYDESDTEEAHCFDEELSIYDESYVEDVPFTDERLSVYDESDEEYGFSFADEIHDETKERYQSLQVIASITSENKRGSKYVMKFVIGPLSKDRVHWTEYMKYMSYSNLDFTIPRSNLHFILIKRLIKIRVRIFSCSSSFSIQTRG
ncbi:hypothetical protein OROMI_034910 [Orobanche minor]